MWVVTIEKIHVVSVNRNKIPFRSFEFVWKIGKHLILENINFVQIGK